MTVAAPPSGTPPKLRIVLDYVPCEACLQEPSHEQELLCSVCRRLDRSVSVKRVEHRTFLVEQPLPPPPVEPEVIPAAQPDSAPTMVAGSSDVAEAVASSVLGGAHAAHAPEPVSAPAQAPAIRVLDAVTAEEAPPVSRATIDVLVEPMDVPESPPPGEGVAEVAVLAAGAALAGAQVASAAPDEDEADVAFAAPPAEAEDEDSGGFDFTDEGPPEDAFDFGREEKAPAPPPRRAETEREPAEADAQSFTFTPPPRDEPAKPEEETPAAAPAAPAEGESPWRRPVEDDWMREPKPAAEEPWPEERAPPPAPADEEPIETLEVVEEEPARETGGPVPETESRWNVEGLTEGQPVEGDEEIVETTIVEESEERWPEERAPASWEAPRPANGDFLVADLDGVKAFDAERLANVGVTAGNDLTGRDPWQLADATGLSAKRLEKWIWVAELAKVAGVPLAAAQALVASGVKGVDGLRVLDPDRGARDANERLPGGAPPVSADDVRAWKART